MKTNKNVVYQEPEVLIVNEEAGGILCASKSEGFGINNMDIVTGGEGSDWDWDF